jgi:arabinan endo-1,5-alpha-L-arabinosidase
MLQRYRGPLALMALLAAAGLGTRRVRATAPEPPLPAPENANRLVHDPCIAREGDTYYVFCTGPGIPIRRSRDLVHWEAAGRVFSEPLPAWARAAIPGSSIPWAPDIARLHGRYYLYYSVSTFGRNHSLIGLATNATLDPSRPEYAWKDEGKVFESGPGDNYNAIDSNVLRLRHNRLALVFGSFWSGIKLVDADAKTGKPLPGAGVRPLARRPSPDAIEAPFLVRHGRYNYLFASFDLCCRGVNSTYNIRVGRSKRVDGPYLDREGKPLLEGGGTVVLATEGRMIGPGHCAVLHERGRDLLVYHFYDGEARGIPTLQVRPLGWDRDGWPVAGPPLE